jgi:hypothetical protein
MHLKRPAHDFRRRPGMAMAAFVLAVGAAVCPGFTAEYPIPSWATSQVSSAMCRGSRMHLVAPGTVAVAYTRAYDVLMGSNLLERVAAAYLRDLPPGAKTNLVITPVGTNGRYLVDWLGDRADVRDFWRNTDTNTFFEGGYVMTGERYFGKFESVMNVRVTPTTNGEAFFRADALIYPHNGLIRFIFKNLLSVERYFRQTMIELSAEITRVCTTLCKPPG